jgi:small subunit ribosomal protein S15
MRAKVKRDRHVKAQSERAGAVSSENVDHILGYEPIAGEKTPWDGCRLQRVLLRPEAIYSAPPVEYAAGEAPQQYLPGLAIEDQQMLFGALPYTSTSLKARRVLQNSASLRQEEDDPHAALTAAEEDKVEQMQRMLDLRNASKRGIEVVNRQRVIEEFGGVREGKGVNTGSSEVQGELHCSDGPALDD